MEKCPKSITEIARYQKIAIAPLGMPLCVGVVAASAIAPLNPCLAEGQPQPELLVKRLPLALMNRFSSQQLNAKSDAHQ